MKYDTDLLEMTLVIVIRALMGGSSQPGELMENVYQNLSAMGISEDEIHQALEVVFGVQPMVEEGSTEAGFQLVVFSRYDPARRIPLELIQPRQPHPHPHIAEKYTAMQQRLIPMEQFELYVEIGEQAEQMITQDNLIPKKS